MAKHYDMTDNTMRSIRIAMEARGFTLAAEHFHYRWAEYSARDREFIVAAWLGLINAHVADYLGSE